MTLRWRIMAGLAAIAAIVGAVGATGSYVSTSSRLHEQVDDFIRGRVAELQGRQDAPRSSGAAADPDGDSGGTPVTDGDEPRPRFGNATVGDYDAATQFLSSTGAVVYHLDGQPTLPVDATDRAIAANGGDTRLRTVTVGKVEYRVATAARPGGAVQVGRTLTEVDDLLATLRLRLLLVGAAGVAIAAALGWFMARRILRPVDRLRDSAHRIAETQDLTTPVAVTGNDEVASLADSFNTMLGALRTTREQQQRLIMDASHELRTPLTSLRTGIELLQLGDRLPPEDRARVLVNLNGELGELTALVGELVDLATDQGDSDVPVEAVDLDELCRRVADRAAARTGRPIGVTSTGATLVGARPAMLERAVSNLVDNAAKYSPDGSPIDVTVDGRRVEVADRGPGIDPADAPFVFDRFYRATATRSMPGSGLGLAIVRQIIVDRHGGTVHVSARTGGGAVVGFELPDSPVPDAVDVQTLPDEEPDREAHQQEPERAS